MEQVMEAQRSRRKRGLVLTESGWSKLQTSGVLQNQAGERYTFEELSDRTLLDSRTVSRILGRRERVDQRSLEIFFNAFSLKLDRQDYTNSSPSSAAGVSVNADCQQQSEELVDVDRFYGRTEEFAQLEQWICGDAAIADRSGHCRLVAIVGMVGIGKTVLAMKLATRGKGQFQAVVWRSLRQAPSLQALLTFLLQTIAQQVSPLPQTSEDLLTALLQYLKTYRCLIVLDGVETVFQPSGRSGGYRKGYDAYSELFKQVGDTHHQSCLVVTSREKPREVSWLEGAQLPVRSLQLQGLDLQAGRALLAAKGLQVSDSDAQVLVNRYAGNPLLLKIAAATILAVLNGHTAEFLRQETTIFGDIRDVLDQQFRCLSPLEQEVLLWLATEQKAVSLTELQSSATAPIPQLRLLETLESLRQRSLIELSGIHKDAVWFSLPPLIARYLSDRLIERVCEEISRDSGGEAFIEETRCRDTEFYAKLS